MFSEIQHVTDSLVNRLLWTPPKEIDRSMSAKCSFELACLLFLFVIDPFIQCVFRYAFCVVRVNGLSEPIKSYMRYIAVADHFATR